MSRQIALDNIFLRPAARWGHTDYSLEYHKEYLTKRTGLPPDSAELLRRAYVRFQFDFRWNTNIGLIDWAKTGRTTDMGHASYASNGSDQTSPEPCPFTTTEEVWAFDAVSE